MPDQSPLISRNRPKVFLDADVLLAGSAAPSEQPDCLSVLRLAEIALLEASTSQQAEAEAERVISTLLPEALDDFRTIVDRCLQIVPDPNPADLHLYAGMADPSDLPILVAALQAGCSWLVSFNTPHIQPGHPDVTALPPGEFLLRLHGLLERLG